MGVYFVLAVAALQVGAGLCFWLEGSSRAAAAWTLLGFANVFFAQLVEK